MSLTHQPAGSEGPAQIQAPPGHVFLEWDATFRLACEVCSWECGQPPRTEVKPIGPGPRPEAGVQLLVRSGSDTHRTWAARIVAADEDRLLLSLSEDVGNQRAYFRMPVHLSLRLLVPDDAMDAEGGSLRPTGHFETIARVVELSGGGCRLLLAPGLVAPGTTCRGFLQLEEDRRPLELWLRILRVGAAEECEEAAAAFVEMRELHRQRILRRLFREYRRLRAL